MKITVIGTGYVGLVTGTCLAEVGNDVLCLDLYADNIRTLKFERIKSGLKAPLYLMGVICTLLARSRRQGWNIFQLGEVA